MTDTLWAIFAVVGGGLVLAGLKWFTSYAIAGIADKVVDEIGERLKERRTGEIERALAPVLQEIAGNRDHLSEISTELATIRTEVTVNGGGSLKDRVLSVERQLETLLTNG